MPPSLPDTTGWPSWAKVTLVVVLTITGILAVIHAYLLPQLLQIIKDIHSALDAANNHVVNAENAATTATDAATAAVNAANTAKSAAVALTSKKT